MATFYEENFKIFFVEKEAINFVENTGRLIDRPCKNISCMSTADLKLRRDRHYVGGYRYTCLTCNQNTAPIKYMCTSLPKIKMCRLLHIIYLYMLKLRNWQVTSLISVCETTYIDLKSKIVQSLESFVDTSYKLGGLGLSVQIDETACCRRRLIYKPTSEEPYIRDTKWVIGVYCETTRRVKLEVLPDRTIPTITDFIKRNIEPGSIIKSDGYPSYPSSVAANGCTHIRVNHSQSFTDEYGNHTNSIESVWAGVKAEIGARRGVRYDNLKEFIREYELLLQVANHLGEEEQSLLFLNIINFI